MRVERIHDEFGVRHPPFPTRSPGSFFQFDLHRERNRLAPFELCSRLCALCHRGARTARLAYRCGLGFDSRPPRHRRLSRVRSSATRRRVRVFECFVTKRRPYESHAPPDLSTTNLITTAFITTDTLTTDTLTTDIRVTIDLDVIAPGVVDLSADRVLLF